MTPLRIGAAPRLLEGVLAKPAGAPRGGAVVCHPHPQMGGDMENPVVGTIADALLAQGLVVVRFNFGGVGRSGGSYSGGPAEVDDVGRAVDAMAPHVPPGLPMILAGYSFGAWAALRAADARVDRVIAAAASPPRRVETIAGADHFFAGTTAGLADAVARAGCGSRTDP